MPDETPQFRVTNEGEPIPPVDPEDLKRNWNIRPGDKEAIIAERAQELDHSAISERCWMIRVLTGRGLNKGELLAPWQHGTELDDGVFRVAATFPIRPLRQHVYQVPGDSLSGFDPNAFVEKLIEETGISHVWEPVPARIPEGASVCSYSFTRAGSGKPTFPPQPYSEREVRLKVSELLWAVWSKCHPNLSRPSRNDEHQFVFLAILFAEFAIDNAGLAREFVSPASATTRDRLAIVLELEREAQSFFRRPERREKGPNRG